MKHQFKIIVSSIALVWCTSVKAQSLPMYSQYMFNMTAINPAYAGNRGVGGVTGVWREQWAGLPGAPTTKSLTYDDVNNEKKVGYGVQVFEDKYVSYFNRTGVNLFYSLKVPVSEKGVLSFGIKGGLYNDVKNLNAVYLGVTAQTNTDIAYASNLNKIVPLAGAGLYYNDDKFYLGFSVPDMILFSKVTNYNSDANLYHVNSLHYYLASGYNYIVNDEVAIKPSVLVKAVGGAPIEADLNTNVWLHNTIGVGASYRTSESILAMLEFQATPQLRIGYGYDMPFKMPNTHEILLRYEFGRLFPNSKSFKLF
jgi:type IX secretion system PorP/SprF family membrane protein